MRPNAIVFYMYCDEKKKKKKMETKCERDYSV